MDFKKRILEELNKTTTFSEDDLDLRDVEMVENLAKEYHKQQLTLTEVGCILPNKALMDSQLSDMISGYKMICKPEANFEKYYSKGFTECWEWLKRIAK